MRVSLTLSMIELKARRGWSQRGRRLVVREGAHSRGSYSLTVMTSLTVSGGFVCSLPRTSSNTAWDFFFFIIELIEGAFLVPGDVLVCDNASIHYSAAIAPHLDALLIGCGVRMLFLPTYSPELNPCEALHSRAPQFRRTSTC